MSSELRPTLTLFPTTAIVLGGMIGSGIFVSSASMVRALPSAPALLAIWILAGALTFFGALSLCELASQMPKTGGLYEFLREIYGEKIGFLYGWANFTIAGTGSLSAIAYIFARYFGEFRPLPHFDATLEQVGFHIPYLGTIFPLADMGTKCVASALILFLTVINILGVQFGAILQSISTSIKALTILALVFVAFFVGRTVGSYSHFFEVTPPALGLSGWTLFAAIGAAMSGAFWSYDGWGNVAYVAGETHKPAKTIPQALVLGTGSAIVLYVLVNLAYLYILPVTEIGTASHDRVASTMVAKVLGPMGGTWIAILILVSTFDCVNSGVLTNPRVFFAMARNGVTWKKLANVSRRFRTPHYALIAQGVWAIVLIFTGTFDMIANMYVFVNWLLYVLMALGVFLLRKKKTVRVFSVPLYPWIPGIFLFFASLYVLVTLFGDIQAYRSGAQPVVNSVMGLVLVLSGLPFYYYWTRNTRPKSDSRS